MKKMGWIFGAFFLATVFSLTGCDTVKGIFNRDLKIKLIVDKIKGIHENTFVNIAEEEALKPIGRVDKVKVNDTGQSLIYLKIFAEHKEAVKERSLFVVMRPLFSVDQPYILIDTLPEHLDNPPIESGSTVYETSAAKYNIMVAGNAIKDAYDEFMVRAEQQMKELDAYLKSDEFEQFMERLREMSEEIAEYTKEQKEKFEKDILPRLQEKIDDALKELEKQPQDRRSDELEQEMIEMKKQIRV